MTFSTISSSATQGTHGDKGSRRYAGQPAKVCQGVWPDLCQYQPFPMTNSTQRALSARLGENVPGRLEARQPSLIPCYGCVCCQAQQRTVCHASQPAFPPVGKATGAYAMSQSCTYLLPTVSRTRTYASMHTAVFVSLHRSSPSLLSFALSHTYYHRTSSFSHCTLSSTRSPTRPYPPNMLSYVHLFLSRAGGFKIPKGPLSEAQAEALFQPNKVRAPSKFCLPQCTNQCRPTASTACLLRSPLTSFSGMCWSSGRLLPLPVWPVLIPIHQQRRLYHHAHPLFRVPQQGRLVDQGCGSSLRYPCVRVHW